MESLCRRIDSRMPQSEMVKNIMKGLQPKILRYIGIMDNTSLKQLKDNIKIYNMIEFMVTEETPQSPSQIKHSFITEQINQITNKFNEQIKQLNDNNDTLKKKISNT